MDPQRLVERGREVVTSHRAAPPALLVVGAAAAWGVVAAVLPRGLPPGVVVMGAVLGSLTGLTAIGLILIYRASRIINFAQGALGAATGVFAVELFTAWNLNYFVAIAAGLASAAAIGGLIDRLVIRRFFWAPRMILTLATIGLAQILGGIELLVPTMFGEPLVLSGFKTPFSVRFEVEPVLFSGNHVIVIAVVPVVLAGLAWFLRGTNAGAAIRASSENAERALLMGVPVRRMSTIVWVIAAMLSALGTMMSAPILGQSPQVLGGPAVLLPALAAAVLARMHSLPRALLAAIGIGIAQQAVFWNSSRGSLVDVGLLVLVLVGLLVQRDRLSRADDAESSSWVGAQESPAIPSELRRLPEVVWTRRALMAAGVLAVIFVPSFLSVSQVNLLGSVTIVYALVGLSLVVLTGWTGQISLGQFAITGVGAVVAGNYLARWSGDLLLALPLAGAAGVAVAILIGLPALRVRGLFLAVTTLAFSVPMSTYFLNPTYFSDALPQRVTRPMLLDRFDLADERTLFYFCAFVLGLSLLLVRGIRAGRPGRVMVALRDNERAVQACGVGAARAKLMAFGVSGALAGMAGALHVLVLNGVRFGSYAPSQSFEAFSMVVIGGLTSVPGAVLGAMALRWTEYVAGGGWQLIITGTGVLVLLLVLPGGLGQAALGLRQRALRLVARRRGIVVPSLLADRRQEEVAVGRVEMDLEELFEARIDLAGAPTAGADSASIRAELAKLQAVVGEMRGESESEGTRTP